MKRILLFVAVATLSLSATAQKSFDEVKKAAQKGDAQAQYELGEMYEYGEVTAIDYAEALKWYKKSAKQGNANGQYGVGRIYSNGLGVEEDCVEGMKWYMLSAEQNNSQGQRGVGNLYRAGCGVEKNFDEAMKWYQKSIKQNDAKTMYTLGLFYIEEYNDTVEGLKWLMKSAENGITAAYMTLGHRLLLQENYAEALKWFKRGEEKGNRGCLFYLGVMYEYELGVEQDFSKATNHFRASA